MPQAGVKRIGTLILHKTLSHQVFTSRFYCGLDSKVGGIEVEKFNLMQSMYRVVFNCPHLFSTAEKIGQPEALQDEELHGIAVLPSWLEAVFLFGTKIGLGQSNDTLYFRCCHATCIVVLTWSVGVPLEASLS